MGYGIKIRVWGGYACFTRPEMKTERVSYDVITPSAARGIIECVYWKPAIKWVIDKITVMAPIRFGNIKLNEVKKKANTPKQDLSKMSDDDYFLYTNVDDNRAQRGMMYLKDPDYIIEAHFELTNAGDDGKTRDDCKKHYNMALRRLKEGKVFKQPCFGLSAFSCNVKLIEDDESPVSPLKGEKDLGIMLYDQKFKYDKNGKALNDADPIFYRPIMKDGVINVAECYKNSAKGGGDDN
jgi:CRISPR-associated protein Cas5d